MFCSYVITQLIEKLDATDPSRIFEITLRCQVGRTFCFEINHEAGWAGRFAESKAYHYGGRSEKTFEKTFEKTKTKRLKPV